MNITFENKAPMAIESPVSVIEGETITFACTYWGVPTTVSCVVYRNRSSSAVTATVMPSGAVSILGNVATLKPATAMVGGNRYTFVVTGTVAGEVRLKQFVAVVKKDEQE